MTAAVADPLDPIHGGWWPAEGEPEPLPPRGADLAQQARGLIEAVRAEAAEVAGELDDAPLRGVAMLAAFADRALAADCPREVLAAFRGRPEADVVEALADRRVAPLAKKCLSVVSALPGMVQAGRALSRELGQVAGALRASRSEAGAAAVRVEGLPGGLEGYQIPDGWTVWGDGMLRRLVERGEGEVEALPVAAGPIFVVGVAEDLATQESYVDLVWTDRVTGTARSTTVARLVAADARQLVTLAGQRAPVTSGSARELVDFISACERVNAALLPSRSVVASMGWARTPTGGRGFLLGRECFGPGAGAVEMRPAPGTEPLLAGWATRGSWERWRTSVAPVVERYPAVGALYLAALASPLLRLLGRPSFIVDLACETGHGKSSALGVAASVWGDPSPGGGVFHTWDGTEVAVERLAALSGDLPLFLDETKLSGGARARDTAQILYRLAAGQGRLRGRPDGLRRVAGWRFVVLSTGEAPVVNASHDAGTRARVLSITAPPYGPQSAEGRRVTEATARAVRGHHGHAGRLWVEHLLALDPDALRQRLEDRTERYAARFVAGTATRLAAHAAVLLLAGDLAVEAGLPAPDLAGVEDLLARVVEAGAADADRPRAALVDLLSWVETNPRRVDGGPTDGARDSDDASPHAGWIASRRPDGSVAVVGIEATAFLDRRGYDTEGVLRAWAGARGWLESPAKGRTKPVRFSDGSRPRCLVVPSEVVEELLGGGSAGTTSGGLWADRDDRWGPR